MNGIYRILIQSKITEELDILKNIFSSFYPITVETEKELLEMNTHMAFDLIILDNSEEEMDACSTCIKLKTDRRTNEIPIIFITNRNDLDGIEKMYECGGIDYIPKPFIPREIQSRVKTQLEIRSMLTHLENLSIYDQMTGIYNRRKFFELGNRIFNDSRTDLYAMIFDIDDFKSINTQFGIGTGDNTIIAVTHAIKRVMEDRAVIGRLGGEEFAALLHLPSKEEAESMLAEIKEEVNKISLRADNEEEIKFSVSGSWVKAAGEHHTLDMLLKDADRLLFDSRGNGRSHSIFRSLND